jgi:putative tricarboxylic transport membrane protein
MNKNHAGGLFFLLVGICFFSLSIRLPIGIGTFTQPGPAIFPLVLSFLLFIIGLLMFFSSKGKPKVDWAKDFENLKKPLAIILLTLAFIIVMGRLGYLATSFLYLFSLLFLVSGFKFFFSLSLSGILAAGSWYFFGKILGIFLPMGPWNL